ncbi:chemotaxis protein CheB [Halopiger goleimassiliensis]|uniref:chemotaxis protein CheB n=1 Tax=Halopiger goleimassiliensis TaxID=1293048 RepID=UPI0006776738|nr:chemotaxis protein CheB [Halopiger goleimassiliensis]
MTTVLVVEDSHAVRSLVDDALETAGYDVVTVDPEAGLVEAVSQVDPDVVIVDLETYPSDGAAVLERLMSRNPTPTLVLASPDADPAALDAFAYGAVTVVRTPSDNDRASVAAFVDDVRTAVEDLDAVDVSALAVAQTTATARSIRTASAVETTAGSSGDAVSAESAVAGVETGTVRPTTAGEPTTVESTDEPITVERTPSEPPTIVVGASTGGPSVVEGLLERLPTALSARVFVVQHMPAAFTPRFADRLDARSEYRVREARDGDPVTPGTAVVAPGDDHLGVTVDDDGLYVRLEDGDPDHGVRPSIDHTMRRVAERCPGPLCGVVLSGMGRDGAAGIEAIDDAGGHTIAQDEATSSVFGIPFRAIRTGCVDEIVPASALADRITAAMAGENDE